MIKVIASDLDGTLLNEHHAFSDKTIKKIKNFSSKTSNFSFLK